MQVAISKPLYQQAQIYAQQQGQNISSMIENYLMLYIQRHQEKSSDAIPDVVASLLGAGEPIADNDLNGRDAYYRYMEEKYR